MHTRCQRGMGRVLRLCRRHGGTYAREGQGPYQRHNPQQRPRGPRQEMINEFMSKTGKRYYSFSLSKFMKKCHEDLDIPIQNYELLINDLKEQIQFASVQQDLSRDNQI